MRRSSFLLDRRAVCRTLNMARGLCSLNIMSSKTPDPLANRAFTIGAPLHSMAGAAGLKT